MNDDRRDSKTRAALLPALAACAVAGCGGTGGLELQTWGEDYIESGIPASDFADGWSVTYSKFLLNLAEVRIADRDGHVAALFDEPTVFDLVQEGPSAVARFDDVTAQRWDEASVVVAPAPSTTAGTASEADAALLSGKAASVHVEGRAAKDGVEKTFAWTFDTDTLYSGCGDEEGAGVVVPAGRTAVAQLTIHGDHFFYDDLVGEEAEVRFDAIAAADADQDGEVTRDELARVDLTTLPLDRYGTGGADVRDLWSFLSAQSRTLVHWNGEGECVVSVR